LARPEFKVKYACQCKEGAKKNCPIVDHYATWDRSRREWCIVSSNGQRAEFDQNACQVVLIKFGLCGLLRISRDRLPVAGVKGLSPQQLFKISQDVSRLMGESHATQIFSDPCSEKGESFPSSMFP